MLLTVERRRECSPQPQQEMWVQPDWNVGNTVTQTPSLHIYLHTDTGTLKPPCRHGDNNSVSSVSFLREQSLLSSLFLPESLTVTHSHTHAHPHFLKFSIFTTCASKFLSFLHLPWFPWWISDMTYSPTCSGSPMMPCQPGDWGHLPLQRFISFPPSPSSHFIDCDNSLRCHRPRVSVPECLTGSPSLNTRADHGKD